MADTLRHSGALDWLRWFGPTVGTRRASLTTVPLNETLTEVCIQAHLEGERLVVDFHWTWEMGAPFRYPKPGVLHLEVGQWGTVHCNARLSLNDGEWSYRRWYINVGLFPEFHRRAFREQPPVKVYSKIAHLW